PRGHRKPQPSRQCLHPSKARQAQTEPPWLEPSLAGGLPQLSQPILMQVQAERRGPVERTGGVQQIAPPWHENPIDLSQVRIEVVRMKMLHQVQTHHRVEGTRSKWKV